MYINLFIRINLLYLGTSLLLFGIFLQIENYTIHLEYHMDYKLIIWGKKAFIKEGKMQKNLMSCQHLQFCHTKSDSIYPLAFLTPQTTYQNYHSNLYKSSAISCNDLGPS